MSETTQIDAPTDAPPAIPGGQPAPGTARSLPTAPCSVVWSNGRAFVLEPPVWVGLDGYGRLARLTPAALDRQGWTHHRAD
ncbi:hypothetical protein L6E12_23890 [Actinokineospora sp. PR83]|uniref:hypothetical protein n=1 Tax=Actinokineospora sp. PR83 TaxID=2884908 RepID=UPI001F23EEFF|nr:hypothetical protein [Actinokineospora sp. PR83]MCG8918825.1 hypothetical protein [Actinokineospora sp. PR83]